MAPTPEQVMALRDAYGGLALQATREADDLEKAAEARRMATWADQVDMGAAVQDQQSTDRAAKMADWQDTVDMDAALQEKAFVDRAAQAMRLREARGLPPIAAPVTVGPVQTSAAGLSAPDANGFVTTASGERVRLLNPGDAPTMSAPSTGAEGASSSPAPQAPEEAAAAMSGGPAMSVAPAPPAPDAGAGGASGGGMPTAPPPLVSTAPPLVSTPPPGWTPPPKEEKKEARFNDQGPGAAGGGRPTGNDRAALVAQAIWDARQAELARLDKGTPYYKIAASPEREQRQNVSRERSLGYDPALLDEQAAIEANPRALTEAAAVPQQAPKPTYDPALLAKMIAPPPGAKTQKDRDAYYASVAQKASAEGISLATLLASGQVQPTRAPADLKPRTTQEKEAGNAAFAGAFDRLARERGLDPSLDQAAMAASNPKAFAEVRKLAVDESRDAIHKARIDAMAAGVDERNTLSRQQFEGAEGARIERVAAKTASDVEKYGEKGQLGFEQEKLRIQAEGHEATAEAERAMAKVAEDAVAKGEELRKKADAAQPGVMQSILGVIGAGLGAFGQGMVGGPNQYIQAAQHRIAAQAASLTDDAAVAKGIEISRLEQIKHNLQAKLAVGMSETAMETAKQMVGKVDLAIIEKRKQLSEATRGNEKTASAVIPARAASVGGGPASPAARLKTLIAMRGDEEANQKLAAGGEHTRKVEKPERGTLGGVKYELEDVTSTAEGHKARDKLATWDSIEAQLKQLEAAASSYGQRAYNPARLEFLANSLGASLSIARGQGVVTNPEAERNVKAVSSWLDPKAVVADIRQMLADDRQSLMTQLGAKPIRR